jgi:hypothetical protein
VGGSMKKKQEKYLGERGPKRFDASPSPSPSPSPKNGVNTTAAAGRAASPLATSAVTMLCLVALLAFLAPSAVQARPMANTFEPQIQSSYYELLEVAASVEGAALKKA